LILVRGSELESVAAADRSYFQVQWSMLGVATIFHEILFGFVGTPDLSQNLLGVPFPEVGAKSALSVFNV